MLIPSTSSKITRTSYTCTTTVLDVVVVAKRMASDAFRLVTMHLSGVIPRASTRRVPSVPLDEGQGVHPTKATRRTPFRTLAVP